ncbi:MAG: aminoacyl-tRNA hydrolase [Candidatus Paceibacterota bacterium]
MKFLLFPLGNHGQKYENSRHNAGRYVLRELEKNNLLEEFKNLEIFIPHCYMNESGEYLKDFLKNKNLQKENIIVMYDDKDLEIGEVRLARDRGDGGHNGLKNIIENLCTKDFYRIRIGIAPEGTGKNDLVPPHGDIVREYVLQNMSEEEKKILSSKEILEKVSNFIFKIIRDSENQ